MEPLLRARLLACPTLPTLPAVALEVLELCERDDDDLDAIGRAVQRDPAIAAKLLRLANSASVATRGKVTTLGRAIAIVGTNATVTTALSFALVRARRDGEYGRFDHGRFWRRAIFCGLAGRALAELTGLDPEETFLAALLQDLGALALAELFADGYGRVWAAAEDDHALLPAAERAALGVDHLEAGELLAGLWNLPAGLQEAIRHSHGAPEVAGRDLGEAVRLSGPLADVWVGPASPGRLEAAVAAAERRFGATAPMVRAALARMALAVPEAAADFELDLGGPELAGAILKRARAARAARGAVEDVAPGALTTPDGARTAREAFDYARTHGHPLGLLVTRPRGGTGAGEVSGLLRGALRRTDVVGPWDGLVLAVVFEPAEGALPSVADRVLALAGDAGLDLAVGMAELREGLPFSGADAFLAAAVADLDADRTRGPRAPDGLEEARPARVVRPC
ncbi:MAG: HDOD domain-containing protein [Anaeromyxobacter sp.]